MVPLIFLGVAAFLLNVALTRALALQRTQIAALKALGYRNRELAWHYLKWALIIGGAGVALGIAAGGWMGSMLIGVYNHFFRFPSLDYRLSVQVALNSVAVALAAAALGAAVAVRRAIAVPPAEAMRPEPPARYRPSLAERVLGGRLTHTARMVLRNIERQPVRAGASVLGIGFGVAILAVGFFFIDSLDVVVAMQFEVVQRQDVTVNFFEPASAGAYHELASLPGVLNAEPVRVVPARLRFGHRERRLAVTGLPASPSLARVVDRSGRVATLPPEGLVVSQTLADILGLRRGDQVVLEVLEGARPRLTAQVTDLVDEYFGIPVYMEIEALRRLLHEGGTVSGAYLQVDDAALPAIHRRLKATPRVAAVNLTRTALANFRDVMAVNTQVTTIINLVLRQHHRLRRGLQRRPHLALRAQPRAGQPARARLHARRDLAGAAGRAGRPDPGGAPTGPVHRLAAGARHRDPAQQRGVPLPPGGQARGHGLVLPGRDRRRHRLRPGRAPQARPPRPGRRPQVTGVMPVPRLLKNRKLLAGAVLCLVLLAVALWPDAVEVDVAPVERGALQVTVDDEGETRVRDRFVISAPVAGRLLRIELEPGDPVRRGDAVAGLSPAAPALLDARTRAQAVGAVDAAQGALGRARAERDRARVARDRARSEVERHRALASTGIVSAEVLEQREAEARAAEDALRAASFAAATAEGELERARAVLLQTSGGGGREIVLHSPVNGVVLRRLRESEAVVPAGEPLLELGDREDLEIVSDLLSVDAVKVKAGQGVLVEQWGGEGALRGRVRRVEPSGFLKISALGVEEQRVNVIVDFQDPAQARALGDGYRVEVRVVVWEGQDVVKAPTSSLFRQGEKWAVFVAQGGRARLRTVEVGQRNGQEAQILAGIAPGESVIVHPSDSIRDAVRITTR